jgi:hypothetical protein
MRLFWWVVKELSDQKIYEAIQAIRRGVGTTCELGAEKKK